jgi:hypothetical protein
MHNSILTTQFMQIDFDITYQHKRSSKLIQRKEKIIEKEKIYIYIYTTQNLPENTVKLFFEKKKKKKTTPGSKKNFKICFLSFSKQTQKS